MLQEPEAKVGYCPDQREEGWHMGEGHLECAETVTETEVATGLLGKDLGNKHPDLNPLLPFCLLTNFPSTKTKLEGEERLIRKRDWTPRAQKTTGMVEYSS